VAFDPSGAPHEQGIRDMVTPTELRATILSWIDEDRNEILQFMQDLVRVRTPNPPGDTRKAMDKIRAYLDGRGLTYEMHTRDETMPNLVATQAFSEGEKHLILNGHIDVFPVETADGWLRDPWDGVLEGAIWGRGSADMKVSATASMMSYIYLTRLAEHLAGKVTLAVVSDEESFGPNGARYLFEDCPEAVMGTAFLNGEPTGPHGYRFGERGALWLRVTVQTPGGHGASPHASPSAIEKAYELIADLKKLADLPINEPETVVATLEKWSEQYDAVHGKGASLLARKTSINIGTITGGVRVNMIASRCTFEVDIRLPNGADADQFIAAIDALKERHGFTYEIILLNRPNWNDPHNELAHIVADTAADIIGIRPMPTVSLGNTDARLWRYKNIPSVVYGPHPRGMGTIDEHVPVEEALNIVRCHAISAALYLFRSQAQQ
jgi:succinyl-diaminopimelate desuccinylase